MTYLHRFTIQSIIACCIAIVSSFSAADQLIIEPDMGRAPIINAIDETRFSLHLVMYGLTDETLLNAVLSQRHKQLNIILEHHPYRANNENDRSIQLFNEYHIPWIGHISPFRLIHQKTLLIDKRKAIIMTFNFTHATFKKERNFAIVIDDPKTVNTIESIFAADWHHQATTHHASNIIYSPDNSREQLLYLINQAKHSLRIYAQSINDYHLIGALAKAAKRGVAVQILTSTNIRKGQAVYLAKAGVKIHHSKHYYIHAKVLLVDDSKAVLGSINFTRPSLDDNRELSILSEDPKVVQALRQTFIYDWER